MARKTESYQFDFHFDQTLWAASLLLKKIGKDVDYLDLGRLLYIAERDHLATEGSMFMGGPIYAMKHGPVLGKPFLLIKGCDVRRSDEWARHIRILPKTRRVRLIQFPENFRLWSEQRAYLYDAAEPYCGDKKIDLEKRVRSFPEWKKHKPAKTESRRNIPWEEILRACGREDLLELANRCFEVRQMVDGFFRKNRQKGNIK